MVQSTTFSYHAFLSYSHEDKRWGEWLHKKLESFHLDEAPPGRPTLHGRVLKPIFRDRVRFNAGPDLGRQTREALSKSASLIVICSPAAVRSRHVGKEVSDFIKLGRAERVFAFIVDGKPHDPSRECFPTSLVEVVDSAGKLTGVRREPIAADARLEGDGPSIALAKLISGLLGLDLQAVWKWELDEERKRRRRTTAYLALVGALALAASGASLLAHNAKQKNEQLVLKLLDRAQSLINKTAVAARKYGTPVESTADYLLEAEGSLREVEAITGQRSDVQLRRAKLSLDFSHIHGVLGDTKKQLSQAEAGFHAMRRLQKEAQDDPDSVIERAIHAWRSFAGRGVDGAGTVERWLLSWRRSSSTSEMRLSANLKLAHFLYGEALRANGRRKQAMEAYRGGLEVELTGLERSPETETDHLLDARLLLGIAMVEYLDRNMAAAILNIKDAASLLERVRGGVRTPEGKELLAETYLTAADAARVHAALTHRRAVQPGHFNDALSYVTLGIQLAEDLSIRERRDASRAQLLARGHLMEGDIRKSRREFASAYAAYDQSRIIRERLHQADPNNMQVRYELAWSYMKLGETRRTWNPDPTTSIDFYEKAIETFDDLLRNRKFSASRKSLWYALWGIEAPLAQLGRFERLLQVMRSKRDVANQGGSSAREEHAMSLADLGEHYLTRARGAAADAERNLRLGEAEVELRAALGITVP